MNRFLSIVEKFAQHRRTLSYVAIAITVIAACFLPYLRIDDNFNNLLKQSAESGSSGLETESDDNACLLLIEGGRILEGANQEALRGLVSQLNDTDHVTAVHSIFDARKPIRILGKFLSLIPGSPETEEELLQLEQAALNHPLIKGKMLSDDARTTLVILELDPTLQRASEYQVVLGDLASLAKRHLENSQLHASVTGIPALQVEMTEAIKWEQILFLSGAELVGLILCFVIFRRASAVLIVQAGPTTAVIWSMGAMACVGEPLNVINSVLAPLVLTIALTDSVHLLLRIRAAMERGEQRLAAVIQGIYHVGPACFLTSITTSVAFASLATANIEVIRRFGWACAGTVIVSFLAVITVVPLLACTRLGDSITRANASAALTTSALALKLDQFVSRIRIILCVSSVLATGLLLSISLRLQPDIQMQQFLPSYGSALQSLKKCDEIFNGLLPVYVVVDWEKSTTQAQLLEAIAEIDKIIADEPRLGSSVSIVDLLQSLAKDPSKPVRNLSNLRYLPPDKIQRLIQIKQRRAIVVSRVRDVGTRHVTPMRESVRAKLLAVEEQWPSLDVRMSGWTVSAGRLSESMLGDMMTSLYIAILISFGVLVIAFRSLRLGLVSLVPNLFPLVATGATMVLLDLPLHFSSATVFSVCFGIAVDDTIHFLWSYSHERSSGARNQAAIRRTIQRVGEALVTSTVIMVFAFAVVVFSNVPSIHEFALIFIVVLFWALVGDLLFLPALLSLEWGKKKHRKRKAPPPQTET